MRAWTKRGREIKRLQELLAGDDRGIVMPPDPRPPVLDPSDPPPQMVDVLNFNSTIPTLHQHQAVLEVEPCCDSDVVCVPHREKGEVTGVGVYVMSKEIWEDMGSPAKITISIFPGDHLN